MQAQRPAAETVTDPVIPTADTNADADTDTDAADTADIVSRISKAYAADPMFADNNHTKRWMFTDNLWWDHDQIVVPKDQEAKRMILQGFHDSPYAGHLGIRKTVKNILRYFTWPNI